jgi:hypothetical protein
MRITKVIVDRASCANDGVSVLVDQAPAAPPSSGPPGRTVLAARREGRRGSFAAS